jgi:MFS family permease
MIAGEYHWTPAEMGWILSGFFAGYMALLIPAGYLVDRFGPKKTLAVGMTWWSMVTLLTPWCRTVPFMTAARTLVGTGESASIPAINGMLVRWFPPGEYSRVAGFCWGGGFAGAILAFPLASAVAGVWGWRAIFGLFAGLGLLWLPFWISATKDQPPGVAELKHERKGAATPLQLLRHSPVWGVFGLHFSSNWYVYVLASWLPTYLQSNRGFSLSQMAVGSALPFVAAFLGTNVTGNLIDRFTHEGNRGRIRKLFLIPSFLGSAALLLMPLVEGRVEVVAVLCVSMFLHTAGVPVQASNSMDLAPHNTGTLVAYQNCFANIAGVVAPLITGYLVQYVGWSSVFWLCAGVSLVGISGFWVLGRSERIAGL